MDWRPLVVCSGMIATLQDRGDIHLKQTFISLRQNKRRGSSDRTCAYAFHEGGGGDCFLRLGILNEWMDATPADQQAFLHFFNLN